MKTLTNEQIYRNLQLHLDNFPIGFPATESGVEIEILKFFFTPLEAMIASCLNLAAKSPAKVQKRLMGRFQKELPLAELTSYLGEHKSPGDASTIELIRDTTRLELSLNIGKQPS